MLKIYRDFSSYKPWSGAETAYQHIDDAGKLGELESMLEELYPDGLDETTLNDILWFDPEYIYESLDIGCECTHCSEIFFDEMHEIDYETLCDDCYQEMQQDGLIETCAHCGAEHLEGKMCYMENSEGQICATVCDSCYDAYAEIHPELE